MVQLQEDFLKVQIFHSDLGLPLVTQSLRKFRMELLNAQHCVVAIGFAVQQAWQIPNRRRQCPSIDNPQSLDAVLQSTEFIVISNFPRLQLNHMIGHPFQI